MKLKMEVLKKHIKLADQLKYNHKRSRTENWYAVQNYISEYKKYNDWSLRDIDIVTEILSKKDL